MSEEALRRDARRWYRQAVDDLGAADVLLDNGRFAQAGFWAQQAAEKALKAVWIALDLEPWGHSVTRLIRDLPEPDRPGFVHLVDAALYLDKLYIPTRYPDALAELIPAEAYTRQEAEAGRDHARAILRRVEGWLAQRGV
jgi:HEPN domain-containing protein